MEIINNIQETTGFVFFLLAFLFNVTEFGDLVDDISENLNALGAICLVVFFITTMIRIWA